MVDDLCVLAVSENETNDDGVVVKRHDENVGANVYRHDHANESVVTSAWHHDFENASDVASETRHD